MDPKLADLKGEIGSFDPVFKFMNIYVCLADSYMNNILFGS